MKAEGGRMRQLLVVAVSVVFATCTLVAKSNGSEIKCIEGVYVLEEFKLNDQIYKAPQVSGRYVIMRGVVLWIFNDRTQSSKETNYAGIGHYTIDDNSYSYQYDEYEVFTQTDAGISVSRKLPWDGMRLYTLDQEPNGLRLRNDQSKSEFFCSGDTLIAGGFGQNSYRKYRRVKSD
jgi:hypothetical protein